VISFGSLNHFGFAAEVKRNSALQPLQSSNGLVVSAVESYGATPVASTA